MKATAIRVSSLFLVLTIVNGFSTIGLSGPLNHAAGFTARITFNDGTTRTAEVQGVGCTASICSRVFIKATEENGSIATIGFDSVTAIKEVNRDTARFVMKNGRERRLAFISDFRVLYISSSNRVEKLDLGTIKSLDILPSAK